MAEILREVMLGRRPELLDDEETRWWPEEAAERSQARERAPGAADLAPVSQRPPVQGRAS